MQVDCAIAFHGNGVGGKVGVSQAIISVYSSSLNSTVYGCPLLWVHREWTVAVKRDVVPSTCLIAGDLNIRRFRRAAILIITRTNVCAGGETLR